MALIYARTVHVAACSVESYLSWSVVMLAVDVFDFEVKDNENHDEHMSFILWIKMYLFMKREIIHDPRVKLVSALRDLSTE